MYGGCCAAALGTMIPEAAARPTAASTPRPTAALMLGSVSVASPRPCFLALKLFISLHLAELDFVLSLEKLVVLSAPFASEDPPPAP